MTGASSLATNGASSAANKNMLQQWWQDAHRDTPNGERRRPSASSAAHVTMARAAGRASCELRAASLHHAPHYTINIARVADGEGRCGPNYRLPVRAFADDAGRIPHRNPIVPTITRATTAILSSSHTRHNNGGRTTTPIRAQYASNAVPAKTSGPIQRFRPRPKLPAASTCALSTADDVTVRTTTRKMHSR